MRTKSRCDDHNQPRPSGPEIHPKPVIAAQAGIQTRNLGDPIEASASLGSRLRGNDGQDASCRAPAAHWPADPPNR
ncbi:hypothetical protein SPHINGOT1_40010 [Sphingomonas sp. T1]|nr:hypothetical protein SPHINGOT1_40010 [Sphingomonas sp. T1]